MSLRKAINAKCSDCIYDVHAAGTKLQQVTLCSVFDCPLWSVRPTTKAPIPDGVLKYYGIEPNDPCLESIPGADTGPNRGVLRDNSEEQTPSTAGLA